MTDEYQALVQSYLMKLRAKAAAKKRFESEGEGDESTDLVQRRVNQMRAKAEAEEILGVHRSCEEEEDAESEEEESEEEENDPEFEALVQSYLQKLRIDAAAKKIFDREQNEKQERKLDVTQAVERERARQNVEQQCKVVRQAQEPLESYPGRQSKVFHTALTQVNESYTNAKWNWLTKEQFANLVGLPVP